MRVHADRFARARRAGDQQVRHLREVGDHRLALEILAERDRQRRARALEVARLDELAERHHLRRRDSAPRRRPRPSRESAPRCGCSARASPARGRSTRFAIWRTFTPGAGSTSNCVTTGPVVRPTSSPSTLKRAQRVHQLHAHRVELALAGVGVARRAGRRAARAAAARRSSASGCVGRLDRRGDPLVVRAARIALRLLFCAFASRERVVLARRRSPIGAACSERIDRRHLLRRRLERARAAPRTASLLRPRLRFRGGSVQPPSSCERGRRRVPRRCTARRAPASGSRRASPRSAR